MNKELEIEQKQNILQKKNPVSKIIAGAKVNTREIPLKKSTVLSRMSATEICCVLGTLLAAGQHVDTL